MIVDFSLLKPVEDEPDTPYLYKNTLFNGDAIEINNGFCVGFYTFENGWIRDKINYRLSGELSFFELMDDGFLQRIEFFSNGKPETVFLSKESLFHADFKFSEDERLLFLNIEGRFFENIKNYPVYRFNPLFSNKKSFKNEILFDAFVTLSGSEVDDFFLTVLANNSHFMQASELSLWETSLTTKSLDIFAAMAILLQQEKIYKGLK